MVRLIERRIPERHHRVTDVFVDGSTMRKDRIRCRLQERVDRTCQRCGIESLRQRRESAQIAEQHSELAQLSAELGEPRIRDHTLDHRRREVTLEYAAYMPAFAVEQP